MLSQATRLSTCTSYRWKWIGCVSTPLWVIFQIWVPSVRRGDRGHVQAARQPGRVQDLGRRVHVGVQDDVLQQRCGARRFEAQVGGHPPPFIEVGRVHLVVDALRLQGD